MLKLRRQRSKLFENQKRNLHGFQVVPTSIRSESGFSSVNHKRFKAVLAKTIKPFVCLFIMSVCFISCKPDDIVEEDKFADVIFFVRKPSNCGFITVNVDGFASQTITEQDFSPTTPFCGDGGATFRNLREGTYNYSAFCDNNEVSGTFTIDDDGCFPVFLDILVDDPIGGEDPDDENPSTFGSAVFWVAEDLGCGPIDVRVGVGAIDGVPIGGQSKTITSFFNQAPECGATGAATFSSLSPFNSYFYRAECSGKIWTGSLSADFGECVRIELKDNDTSGGGKGDVIFWANGDYGCGPIDVTLTGVGSGTITSFFGQAPNCGTNGTANFNDLVEGTYNYTASCNGQQWSGTVGISNGSCTNVLLANGSDGNDAPGSVKFWVAEDFGCGNITVDLSGRGSSVITGFFNSAPDCDNTNSGGNFDNLTPGNYTYTASCSGLSWSGSITIAPNGCLQLQLGR